MRDFLRKLLRPKAVTRAEELADQMIALGKRLGATTPRHAAEMAQGHPLTDEQWGRVGDVWIRRWY